MPNLPNLKSNQAVLDKAVIRDKEVAVKATLGKRVVKNS